MSGRRRGGRARGDAGRGTGTSRQDAGEDAAARAAHAAAPAPAGAGGPSFAIDSPRTRLREDALAVERRGDGWLLSLHVPAPGAGRSPRDRDGLTQGGSRAAWRTDLLVRANGTSEIAWCGPSALRLDAAVPTNMEGAEAAARHPRLAAALRELECCLDAAEFERGRRVDGGEGAHHLGRLNNQALGLFAEAAVRRMARLGLRLVHAVQPSGRPDPGVAWHGPAWRVPPRPGRGVPVGARFTGTLRERKGWVNTLALAASFSGAGEPSGAAAAWPDRIGAMADAAYASAEPAWAAAALAASGAPEAREAAAAVACRLLQEGRMPWAALCAPGMAAAVAAPREGAGAPHARLVGQAGSALAAAAAADPGGRAWLSRALPAVAAAAGLPLELGMAAADDGTWAAAARCGALQADVRHGPGPRDAAEAALAAAAARLAAFAGAPRAPHGGPLTG